MNAIESGTNFAYFSTTKYIEKKSEKKKKLTANILKEDKKKKFLNKKKFFCGEKEPRSIIFYVHYIYRCHLCVCLKKRKFLENLQCSIKKMFVITFH